MNEKKAKLGRKALFNPDQVNEVERLAALGLNEAQISESIGMSYATFQRNKANFEESLKKGKAELRARVSEALLSKIEEGDTTALIFTAKRLNLFTPSIDAKVPKSVSEAVKELARVYSAHAHGEIGDAQADKLISMLDKFIKGIELSEIEERLTALEEIKR